MGDVIGAAGGSGSIRAASLTAADVGDVDGTSLHNCDEARTGTDHQQCRGEEGCWLRVRSHVGVTTVVGPYRYQ